MRAGRRLHAVLLALALPAAAAASEDYNAATTHAKLAARYPFIQVADSTVPATVEAIRELSYARRGERVLSLDLYLPAARPQALPAIVLVHGGGWRSGTRANLAPLAIRLAERGYAAATISYRLAPEARYPAAIHDVKAALRWLRTHAARYGIDPQRIAVGGGSAGGQIASLAGVTNGLARFDPDGAADPVPATAQAIVNIDGLSDFTSPVARRHEDDPAKRPSAAGAWFGGRYAEVPALWRGASPVFYVNRRTPPILFIGSGQPRFAVGREEMVRRLEACGVGHRVVLLPGTPHSFWLFDPWLAPTVEAIVGFLDEWMGDAVGTRGHGAPARPGPPYGTATARRVGAPCPRGLHPCLSLQ